VLVGNAPHFTEALELYALEDKNLFSLTQTPEEIELRSKPTPSALIHQALLTGLRGFFHKQGFSKAVLGLSGGIDSALVAALAAEALGPENVTAILMPGPYSSDHSITDAEACAQALGIAHHTLPIKDAYEAMLGSLKGTFEGMPFGLAEENLQARLRGMTLMAWSNKFGALVLNTSNKSEAAVGYGTLYGDMCGALSVIGDVYKTECYALAAHLNAEALANGRPAPIPESTLTKPPSAELRPDQKDSDSLPEYPVLDAVLRAYLEGAMDAEAILELGMPGVDEALVQRVIKLVNGAEHKRYQAPTVLRVSAKAFVIGRRMPLVVRV
jgi:NAD+ synthase (glutamine-hydrolysing)